MSFSSRRLVALSLTAFLVVIVTTTVFRTRVTPPQNASIAPLPTPANVPLPSDSSLVDPAPEAALPTPAPAEQPTAIAVSPNSAAAHADPYPIASPRPQPAAPPEEQSVPLPVARTALDYVGADPDAELVWAAAINDPALSKHDRQDLIEDLNENGLSDPKHPTPDDLPLIVSRLTLIEDLAPDAMDETNADAFAEAYKDLANMYDRLTGP